MRKTGETQKLLPRFRGLFRVVKRLCANTYVVEHLPSRRRRIRRRLNAHVAQMRPFHLPTETEWPPEEEAEEAVG